MAGFFMYVSRNVQDGDEAGHWDAGVVLSETD
jgi:hypothetical protein